ncbi:NRPS [Trichoderma virens FT-333]|nr:NRPS [Trichoderma virens FT-333]
MASLIYGASGDLCFYNHDGNIVFSGRKDTQVKVRGFRVELGDIEHHIRDRLDAPCEVAVEVLKTTAGANLIAFVTFNIEADAANGGSSADIFLHLDSEKHSPKTEMETRLQIIWAELLNIPTTSISRDDSFLQIGGDSIMAIHFVNAARDDNIGLTVADIFDDPRLLAIAAKATNLMKSDPISEITQFGLLDVVVRESLLSQGLWEGYNFADNIVLQDAYPCTKLQEGLLALAEKQPGSYIAKFVYRLNSNIDVQKFRAAFEQTVKACNNLRTRIVILGNTSVQVVLEDDFAWDNLEGEGLRSYVKSMDSFKMAYGSRLHRYAIAEDNGDTYFIWTLHHSIYDGWTIRLMMEVLHSIYEGFSPAHLQPYNKFVEYIANVDHDQARNYWGSQLQGASRAGYPSFSGSLKASNSSTIIRAAWAILLARYCESDDVCFGVTVSGRQAPVHGLSEMPGPAVATVPIRIQLNKKQTVLDYLGSVQSQASKMVPYEQFGLQEIAKISSAAQEACNFSSLLVIQPMQHLINDDNAMLLPVQIDLQEDNSMQNYFNYPLVIQGHVTDEDVKLFIIYDPSVLPESQILAISHQLEHIMKQLISKPESQLGALSLSCNWDVEFAREANGEDAPEILNTCLPRLIETQAEIRPEAIAVQGWDKQFTYNELNRAANRLAHHLVSDIGVKPHDIVQVCFSKSAWYVVAILAINKAGAAWGPIDPSHPLHRHQQIISQTKAQVALTSPDNVERCSLLVPSVVTVSSSLDSDLSEKNYDSSHGPDVTVTSHYAAYVLFTSGSTGVELVAVGGEPLPRALFEEWVGKVRFFNCWGPSETCVMSAMHEYKSEEESNMTIGRPVGGFCWIVDPEDPQRLAPTGTVGELIVQGPTLLREYLGDPEKSKASILCIRPDWALCPDSENWSRFYKSGDLCSYNPDGTIKFSSRKDTQVKVRGLRVELGEVEYRIKEALHGALQVAVDVFKSGTTSTLAAYFCFSDATAVVSGNEADNIFIPLTEEVQQLIATMVGEIKIMLPEYMIPALFIQCQYMPTATSGKMDRKTLKMLTSALTQDRLAVYSLVNSKKVMPQTPMESKLQAIWADILAIPMETIGRDDSFLSIGGDSIAAIRLVTAARDNGIALTVSDIFHDARLLSVASRASFINECEEAAPTHIVPFTLLDEAHHDLISNSPTDLALKLPYGMDIEDAYPCSKMQEGLMALSVKQPGSYIGKYNYLVPAHADVYRLRVAWEQIINHFPNLRTRIIRLGAASIQVVIKGDITWDCTDQMTMRSYLQETQIMEMGYGSRLCRYAIIEDDGRFYFSLNIHHAVYDGWTLSIIFRAFHDAYRGLEIASLVPYSHFIKYTMELDYGVAGDYWAEQLRNARKATFPSVAIESTSKPEASRTITTDLKLSRINTSITTATLVRAAWAIVLARYCDSTDVCFGATVSGRQASLHGLSQMPGPVIATIPVRIRFEHQNSTAKFLEDVQTQAMDMIPYEQFGLQNIRKLNNDAEEACDFASLLVIQPLQMFSDNSSGDGDALLAAIESTEESTDAMQNYFSYPLVVQGHLSDDFVRIVLIYNPLCIPEKQIIALSEQIKHVISQLAESQPGQTLGNLSLVSQWDIEQSHKFNADIPEVINSCFHDLVEYQATHRPSAMAIRSWDGEYTYAELNQAANRLANHLVQTYDIKTNELIHVCFEKSVWYFISILAINKVGAAWVPIDPSHPIQRLQQVVNQTRAKIALCSPDNVDLCYGLVESVVQVATELDSQLLQLVTSQQGPASNVSPNNIAYVLFTTLHEWKSIDESSLTIGRPVGGFCWIVDVEDSGRLAPFGTIGEIVIQGPTLLQEYLADPERTNASIRPSTEWCPRPDGTNWNRFYKSGDLCRYNTDGTIEFSTRKDTQIKIRGLRVELSEVEYHIQQALTGVRQVAVDLFNGDNGSTLVAYICFSDETRTPGIEVDNSNTPFSSPDESLRNQLIALVGELGVALPRYMIPTLFIPCKYMPFITSTKLDRKLLQRLLSSLSRDQLAIYSLSNDEKRQPQTEMERRLQLIWAEIMNLPMDSIGRDDTFFQLGGDSIMAIYLVSTAQEDGISLTVKDVFDDPRLLAVATKAVFAQDAMDLADSTPDPFSLLPESQQSLILLGKIRKECGLLNDQTIIDAYPCSSLQEGLIALTAKQPGSYVATYAHHLSNSVDIPMFMAAWDSVVEVCDNLRTRIIVLDGVMVQIVLNNDSNWVSADNETLESMTGSSRNLKMGYGTPLCWYAIVSDKGENYFVWSAHHSIYDGWTMRVMFSALYCAYQGDYAPEVQVRPFSTFIKSIKEHDSDKLASYWREELAGAKHTSFPSRRTVLGSTETKRYSSTIAFSRSVKSSITQASILRAAWAIVLARYCDSNEAVFGATVSGRQAKIQGAEMIAGPMIATVPIRARLNNQAPISRFLQDIQNLSSAMIPYEQFGIQNISKVSPEAKEVCDFSSLLVVQPPAHGAADDGDDSIFITDESANDLTMNAMDGYFNYPFVIISNLYTDKIQLNLFYDPAVLSEPQVVALASHLDHVTQQLLAKEAVNAPLSSVTLLSPWDLQHAVQSARLKPSSETCTHWLIQETVQSRPNDIAILSWDAELTYSQVGTLASRLAVELQERGVGPESLVLLCFPKSAWAVIAMVAIEMAGGAFVPLDPSAPAARLKGIIDDTHATLAIASPSSSKVLEGLGVEIMSVDQEVLSGLPDPVIADLLSPTDVPDLKMVCLGGEAISKKCADRWVNHVELHGLYGPAEASICAWNPLVGKSGRSTNLGRPISSAFWVVEPSNVRQLVPVGCIGELLIEGPMLARGYLNVSAEVAANWIEDVDWLPGGRKRVYRTGDLVRRNADGTFDYMGRKDTQVKLHGQRVELGEIESQIHEFLPRNMAAIVDIVTADDENATNILMAFLWYTEDNDAPSQTLQLMQSVSDQAQSIISHLDSSLAESLPSYMIPSSYLIFEGKPEQTSSGKINRRSLVELGRSASVQDRLRFTPDASDHELPTTPMELQLQSLWAQVLKMDDPTLIGKHDSFLHLGGDSISAIELVSLAQQRNISLTVAMIFKNPRLSSMAETIQTDFSPLSPTYDATKFSLISRSDRDSALRAVKTQCKISDSAKVEDIYPCTDLQTGLMALTINQPGSYIAKHVYHLASHIDIERFKQAWEKTVGYCTNLRTRIVLSGNTAPAQQFVPTGNATEPAMFYPAVTEGLTEGELLGDYFSYPLVMQCQLLEDDVQLGLIYQQDVINDSQVNALAEQFSYILERLQGADDVTLAELSAAGPWDIEQVIKRNSYSIEPIESCTGDLVRYNHDGSLDYLGRKDTQVKIRGQRIELGEIEYQIKLQSSEIKHAVVDIICDDIHQSLVAFVSLSGDKGPSEATPVQLMSHNNELQELFSQLAANLTTVLPSYMVPKYFIAVESMPLNTSGKLDRKALLQTATSLPREDLAVHLAGQRLPFRDASSDLEHWIRAQWADILEMPREAISVDDNFYQLGGDSIRIVNVSRRILDKFGVSLGNTLMNSKHTTISNMAKYISLSAENGATQVDHSDADIDLMVKINSISNLPWMIQPHGLQETPRNTLPGQATVFLTGATGFLGTEILKQLVRNPVIKTIAVHVRSKSLAQGMDRIRDTAKIAGWWREEDMEKLEIWLGDLAKPHLGLAEAQWERLSGLSKSEANINAIVHNGASVNWNANYDTLCAANVTSTVDLLMATATSPHEPKFVFVSGGAFIDPAENQVVSAAILNSVNGYSQTKFVCESVISNIASRLPANQNRVSIVKPGRIIGTVEHGVANVDDFVWRVVSTAASIHAYPEEPSDHWMAMQDVGIVASNVLNQLFTDTIKPFSMLASGMPLSVFWDQVNSGLEVPCKPLSWQEWTELALASMNRVGNKHPLWPVQQFLGQLGLPPSIIQSSNAGTPECKQSTMAIESNMRYLRKIGFIHSSEDGFGSDQREGTIRRVHTLGG